MSFSDFGGPKKAPASGGLSTAGSTDSRDGLGAISETLLQYQRNVGILERIVQSIGGPDGENAVLQYEAQNHVLQELEQKVKRLVAQQPKQNTAVIKLQRDFQRVQMRTTALQEQTARKISALSGSQSGPARPMSGQLPNSSSGLATTTGGPRLYDTSEDNPDAMMEQHQRLQQQQILEDRLQEQIMREREQEIRSINQGMHTVNEIYKDLAHIVGEQQDQIDNIETQMEDSRANAESGLSEVEKANEKYGNGQCSIM